MIECYVILSHGPVEQKDMMLDGNDAGITWHIERREHQHFQRI
jgi:hypothetical protein